MRLRIFKSLFNDDENIDSDAHLNLILSTYNAKMLKIYLNSLSIINE